MRHIGLALVPAFALVAATANAQEDAGVADAEDAVADPADAGVAANEDAPPTADSFAPQIDPKFRAATAKRYEMMLGSGVMLEVVGVAALITSFSFAMGAAFAFNNCNIEGQFAGCEEEAAKHKKRDRTVAWVALPVGIVAIAVGTPLLVRGARGHKRQKSRGTARLDGLWISASPSRGGPSGGLILSGSF